MSKRETAPKFKPGDWFRWASQAGGAAKGKRGKVIHAGASDKRAGSFRYYAPLVSVIDGDSNGRGHVEKGGASS